MIAIVQQSFVNATFLAKLIRERLMSDLTNDPMDGSGPYAVMVGLAREGRYEAALVALPREGLYFDAVRGGPARVYKAGSTPRPAQVHEPGNRVLVSHGLPAPVFEALRDHGWDPVPACGGAIAVAPLVKGVRAGLRWGTAEQGVSIRGRIGLLIAREAGMCVCGAGGAPFPDDVDTPAPALLIASREDDLEVLDAALALREAG